MARFNIATGIKLITGENAMNTATATKTERMETATEIVNSKGAVTPFAAPRLPYHDAVEKRFGIDKSGWKTLVEAIWPNARSADSIVLALSYCRARKLDPFKRQVHIVPMWSSQLSRYVETIWPGISELRTTAFRTGQYAGKGETEFGPTIQQTFNGTNRKGDTKSIVIPFPEWARLRLTRVLNGRECTFVSPKVYWLEAYAKWGDTEVPNDMWAKRPSGQLEKCVEAAALRCTFPEEIGNDYTAEEMEGQRIIEDHGAQDVPPPVPHIEATQAPPPVPEKPPLPTDTVEWTDPETGEVSNETPPPVPPVQIGVLDTAIPPTLDRTKAFLDELANAFSGCESLTELAEEQQARMMPLKAKCKPATWKKAEDILAMNLARIQEIALRDEGEPM